MLKKFSDKNSGAFTLIELSIVIIIIAILLLGVIGANMMVKKFTILSAQTQTQSSPIHGIPDASLWLESSLESSFIPSEAYDTSFLNNSDYTIFILEKRKSNSADNYFFGDSPTGTANQKLALGYSVNNKIIHAQGTNSYTSNVSTYEASSGTPRIYTFVQNKNSGKKTYISGVLAGQNSDTSQLNGISTIAIGKSYTGEIGEIAIFSRALKDEERQSVEDYMGKKWSSKILRSSVSGGSCTT